MPEKHPIHAKYPGLHKSPVVEKAVTQHRRHGERIPNEPGPKLEAWLSDLERIHTGRGASAERQAAQPQVLERIKRIYHRDYITGTDDDSVERYLRHQAQIEQDRGRGMVEEIMAQITDEQRERTRGIIESGQKRSLDRWIDYLTDPNVPYPMWFKYYVFRNITGLAALDKQKGVFPKRSKSTTAIFPDLNPEALAYTMDAMAHHYKIGHRGDGQPEEELSPRLKEALDKNSSFADLYVRAIELALPKNPEVNKSTEGVWVKYEQTGDFEQAKKLSHSLHGYNTGWCVAGEDMALEYLRDGDFYVYYTAGPGGDFVVPRVGIPTINHDGYQSLREVRGIEANQNLEGALVPIAEAKMNEVDPQGAEAYKKKAEDMRQLTDIYARHSAGEELTKEDLRFIYELDGPIEGFGYQKDPRIDNITSMRNIKADLSFVLDVPPGKISLTKEEALSGGIVYHYGDLYLGNLTSAEGLTLPASVGGNLDLHRLTSAEGLTLPHSVGGGLYLHRLTSAEGLTLPASVGGYLALNNLTSAEGLTLPDSVGGDLDLHRLTSAEGLTLPDSFGGSLDLSGLTSAEGLTLPDSVGGLDLSGLTSAEGLTLPASVGGLDLSGLTSAEGLTLPTSIGGYLFLYNLTSAEGLTLPASVGGGLDLSGLTSAEGLTLPTSIGGYLFLYNLTSAEGLTLPHSVGGSLYLNRLTSAEGLTLPDSVGGDLRLDSITSAEGLILPQSISGNLDLRSLLPAERSKLREQRPDLADKIR